MNSYLLTMEPIRIDLSQIPAFRMIMAGTGAQDTEAFIPEAFDQLYKGIGGIEKNSLTTSPAIGLKAVLQSSGLNSLKLVKNTDQAKRLITGIKMVPDQLLLKTDDTGKPHFDMYTKEVIYHARNKFMMNGNVHALDWEHTGPQLSDIYLVESWLVEDSANDKLNALGFDQQFRSMGFDGIPVGTWAVSYFVPSDKLWNEMMTNPDGYGFSIKGYFAAAPVSSTATDKLLAHARQLSHRDDMTIDAKCEALLALMKDA